MEDWSKLKLYLQRNEPDISLDRIPPIQSCVFTSKWIIMSNNIAIFENEEMIVGVNAIYAIA